MTVCFIFINTCKHTKTRKNFQVNNLQLSYINKNDRIRSRDRNTMIAFLPKCEIKTTQLHVFYRLKIDRLERPELEVVVSMISNHHWIGPTWLTIRFNFFKHHYNAQHNRVFGVKYSNLPFTLYKRQISKDQHFKRFILNSKK